MRKASVLIVLLLVSSLILPVVKADGKPGPWWVKSYGGSSDDGIGDVKVLSDGSIIAVGWTNSTGAGDYDALVMKLNPDGSVAWAKTYGGSGDDAYAVALAPNGDIVVVGTINSSGTGGYDAWVLRLLSDGNLPGCDFCGNSNAEVNVPSPTIKSSDAIVRVSNAQVENSNAYPHSANLEVQTQYTYQPPAHTVAGGEIPTTYILAGLLILGLIGGALIKVRGVKGEKSSREKEKTKSTPEIKTTKKPPLKEVKKPVPPT